MPNLEPISNQIDTKHTQGVSDDCEQILSIFCSFLHFHLQAIDCVYLLVFFFNFFIVALCTKIQNIFK